MRSSTTSVRLSNELKLRLEITARATGKGKNAIITEALDEFLRKHDKKAFAAEIRRQSLNCRKATDPDADYWESLADTDDWK